MGRLQILTVSDFAEITSGAMFRASKQHVTETHHGKQRHGMNLLIAYNKDPLLTMSQKGTENMMALM